MTIPDSELLEMILRGEIKLKYKHTRDPVIVVRGRELKPSIVPGKHNPRYRIEICRPKRNRERKRRKRTIVRHKIIWMIHHRKIVPLGHELHHWDEDRFNDSVTNILDWTEREHRSHHNGVPF